MASCRNIREGKIARGGSVEGLIITRDDEGARGTSPPEVLVALDGPAPAPRATGTMTENEVAAAIRAALPPWASAGVDEVVDDAGRERVVKLSRSLAPIILRAIDPTDALQALLTSQETLGPAGARIGRSIVQITDALTSDPLYSAAGDAQVGFVSVWHSPLIAGFWPPALAP